MASPTPESLPDSRAYTGLARPLSHQLKTYVIDDLPIKCEKFISLGIIQFIMTAGASASDPKTCHIANLVQLGFYFCLRSYDCTKCTGYRRTVEFLPLLEFGFFVGDHLLPADALIEHFQYATHIVLTLDNHNNYIQDETVSYFRSESLVACSVRAGKNIFLCMQKHGCPATPPVINHPSQQLSCRQPRNLLRQCLRNYLCPQGRYASSGRSQIRIIPRRSPYALSPPWQSHGRAHCGGPRLHPYVHRLVDLARTYGLYSTIYLIHQCRHLGAYEPTTLVSVPLSILLSTEPPQHLMRSFSNPLTVL